MFGCRPGIIVLFDIGQNTLSLFASLAARSAFFSARQASPLRSALAGRAQRIASQRMAQPHEGSLRLVAGIQAQCSSHISSVSRLWSLCVNVEAAQPTVSPRAFSAVRPAVQCSLILGGPDVRNRARRLQSLSLRLLDVPQTPRPHRSRSSMPSGGANRQQGFRAPRQCVLLRPETMTSC